MKKKNYALKKSSKDLGISKKISILRHHFELSAEALGEKAGVSGTAISNIERGDSLNPGAEMLVNISRTLGINLNWLLMGEEPMLKDQHGQSASLSAQQLEEAAQRIVAAQTDWRNHNQLASSLAASIVDRQATLRQMVDDNQRLGERILQAMMRPEIFNEREQQLFDSLKASHAYNNEQIVALKKEIAPLQHALDRLNQVRLSAVYQLEGIPDSARPYGGLLAYRLNTTDGIARQLVHAGKIHISSTAGRDCVTEQSVREFLGEA